MKIAGGNKNSGNQKQVEVIVSIKDTGTCVHSEILLRLFTKFATKSESGTGL
jgi:C4-dicarboxylate-specific signal transduction histidine kinase